MQRRRLRDREGRACARGEVASTNSTQRKGARRLYVWESCHFPQVEECSQCGVPIGKLLPARYLGAPRPQCSADRCTSATPAYFTAPGGDVV